MVPARFGTSMVTNKLWHDISKYIVVISVLPLSSPALRPSSGQNANEHHQIQITKSLLTTEFS